MPSHLSGTWRVKEKHYQTLISVTWHSRADLVQFWFNILFKYFWHSIRTYCSSYLNFRQFAFCLDWYRFPNSLLNEVQQARRRSSSSTPHDLYQYTFILLNQFYTFKGGEKIKFWFYEHIYYAEHLTVWSEHYSFIYRPCINPDISWSSRTTYDNPVFLFRSGSKPQLT